MVYIFKTENINISSLGTTIAHGLGVTPSGTYGETRIVPRSVAAASGAIILSLSDSVNVCVQAMGGNNVVADVICQAYHSIIR